MASRSLLYFRCPRMQPLAACVAAALVLSASGAIASEGIAALGQAALGSGFGNMPPHAAHWPSYQPSDRTAHTRTRIAPLSQPHPSSVVVTNCDDSGSGSLRDAVQNVAVSGDTVDLSQLGCSTISLTTGAIIIAQASLTIHGPGRGLFGIDGTINLPGYGVLFHNGSGTLSIDNLTVSGGAKYTNVNTIYANGGCIYSAGNVMLSYALVSSCSATTGGTSGARGGGVYTQGDVTLSHVTVIGNSVQALAGPFARGGGVFANGNLRVTDSEIIGNQANAATGTSTGGGVVANADATFTNSSILGNISGLSAGGIYARSGSNIAILASTIADNRAQFNAGLDIAAELLQISNSTISGNIADSTGGAGILLGTITISNSTIAFNSAMNNGGISIGTSTLGPTSVLLESSIIADNSASGIPSDFLVYSMPPISVTGSANLITSSNSGANLPPDTITSCPRLEPLAYNGGPILTHALPQPSPAIDAGNNDDALNFDERGSGFPRVFGPATDIGAFEWQGGTDDGLFNSGFELVCDQ